MTKNGDVPSLDNVKKCREICDSQNVGMHLDGARFFNACVTLNVEP